MDVEAAKRAVADAAAALVEDGQRVGLGSGSTVHHFLASLARRVGTGLRMVGVPSSRATADEAARLGIPLTHLGRGGLDTAIDGADCVDPRLNLIKGAGGAHVWERMVAASARRFVVIVDASKEAPVLTGSVPVELLAFGIERTLELLEESTGARFERRRDPRGDAIVSDSGNPLADGRFTRIDDAAGLAEVIDAVPGVIGHGLFVGMAHIVLVGRGPGDVATREAEPAAQA